MANINQIMKKGLTNTTIENTKNANRTTIIKARMKLLEPLVKDQELRKILTQDTNFQKLKNRLTHQITGLNNNNEKVLTTELYGKTIQETIKKINEEIQDKTTDYISLKGLGYQNTQTDTTTREKITKINLKTILRKG